MCYVPSLNTGLVHEGEEDLNIIFERGKTAVCVGCGGVGNKKTYLGGTGDKQY